MDLSGLNRSDRSAITSKPFHFMKAVSGKIDSVIFPDQRF